MDDLMLNVITTPKVASKSASNKPTSGSKKGTSGFDWKWNKGKVKATVVRRRDPQTANPIGANPLRATVPPKAAKGAENDIMLNTIVSSPTSKVEKKETKPKQNVLKTKFQQKLNEKRPKSSEKRPNPAEKSAKSAENDRTSAKSPIKAKYLEKSKPVKGDSELKKKPQKAVKVGKVEKKAQRAKQSKEIRSYLFDKGVEVPTLGKSRVEPVRESVFSGMKIEALSIHPYQIKNIEEVLGFSELTRIQERSVPVALEGKDLLLRSQTGSGKTLCYALPVVERLSALQPRISRSDGIYALIVVPTRELALQSYELLLKLVKPFQWIVPGYLSGGEKRKAEKARLRNGINVLVGTPGRLCDHLLHTEALKLSKVQFFILDEADRLFELGYEKDVRNIVDVLRKHRGEEPVQTMMLSATLTAAVKELAGLTLKDPTFIDCQNAGVVADFQSFQESEEIDVAVIPDTVSQSYVIVPPKLRLVTLSGIIAHQIGKKKHNKVLIFMATLDLVDYHYDVMVATLAREKSTHESDSEKELDDDEDLLGASDDEDVEDGLLPGLRFFKLHGSMTQIERSSVFKEFRSVKTGVLLCTDVAARGLDVPKVDVVVQYDPPQKISDYVHRVGRTARAGREGKAVLFLSPTETLFIEMLETKKIQINQDDMEMYLKGLLTPTNPCRSSKDAAIELQREYEELVTNETEIKNGATKAFISWVRFYSTFPRDLRRIFNVRSAHMGHHAKSLGLREAPTSFAREATQPKPEKPRNRLTVEEKREPFQPRFKPKTLAMATSFSRGTRVAPGGGRFSSKGGRDRTFAPKHGLDFNRGLKTSRMLNVSEFDSGLPPTKKRKT